MDHGDVPIRSKEGIGKGPADGRIIPQIRVTGIVL